jgi:hypothetical protein
VATSNGTASTHEDRLPGTQPSEAAGFSRQRNHPMLRRCNIALPDGNTDLSI